MAEIIAPPTLATDASAPTQSIDAPIPVPGAATEAPAPPAEPEFVSETLYIQNLNEKIKIPSTPHPPSRFACNAYDCGPSYETDVAKLVQALWTRIGCCCAPECAHARTGFRFIRVARDCETSGERG